MLYATLGGEPMGARSSSLRGDATLQLSVHASAPVRSLELIRSGEVVDVFSPESFAWDLEHEFSLGGLEGGEYVYVRIQQLDGGLAWTSPWFIAAD